MSSNPQTHEELFQRWIEWFEANPNWAEDLKQGFPEYCNEIAQKRRERLNKREGATYYTGLTYIIKSNIRGEGAN